MSDLIDFKIIPILGRKTSVPADDVSLMQAVSDDGSIVLTYDVGGLNFDLTRKLNACTKAQGYLQWDEAANGQATRCLALFELYDGVNRNWLMFDNGHVYYFTKNEFTPTELTATPTVVFNQGVNPYCVIRAASHMIFSDFGQHTPYKWTPGDSGITKLINEQGSGYTEYKFRYLTFFMRRIIGLYSDQTNGDIDIRYTSDLPSLTSDVEFPAENQLWVPNDDPIRGVAKMGTDSCFVFCENSINQIVYYPDYTAPFRAFTAVQGQGAVNHHSIVNAGNRLFLFNENYGFCEYRGGSEFPYGGRPISEAIEADFADLTRARYPTIVGVFIPWKREICWTMPGTTSGDSRHLLFYHIDSGNWRKEDKVMTFVDSWKIYPNYTFTDFETSMGGAGSTFEAADGYTWSYFAGQETERLVYANTDGHLYYRFGETLAGAALDGYRIEPILNFGDSKKRKLLQEVWFDLVAKSNFSIHVYHRGGESVGEVEAASWTEIGTISHNGPAKPVVYPATSGQLPSYRLHQLKWRTDAASEKFQVNGITFRFQLQSDN